MPLFFLWMACALFAGLARAQGEAPLHDIFTPAVYTNAVGSVLPYRIYRVEMEATRKPLPLVVFLHGSGGCGTNNLAQLDGTVAGFLKTLWKKPRSAVFMAPQCPPRDWWVKTLAMNPEYRFPRYPSGSLRAMKDLCAELVEKGEVDPGRVYLVGGSLGGFGAWDAAMRWPDFFAAAIPICGGGASSDDSNLRRLARVPVWAFHGDQDRNVPVDCSRRMIEGIKRVGGSPKYTEYPNAGHAVWGRAVGSSEVVEWLFDQAISKRGGIAGWLKNVF